ncbi:MAG: metallophosphoesterase [Myxococcota bacterium]
MRTRGLTAALMSMLWISSSCGEPSSTTNGAEEGSGSADSSTSAPPPGTSSSATTPTPTTEPTPPPTTDKTSDDPEPVDLPDPSDSDPSDDASDTGEPPVDGEPGVVRFAAFGDTGEGNEAQQMVANAAEVICAERGCDFALLLGDNFYDTGVTQTMDPQFIDKFEAPYEGLDIPFYVVLGNHDYGELASDWNRGNYQVEYSTFSDKWVLPNFWYTFSSDSGGTQFFAFDTSRMMWNHDVNDQREWIAGQMAASTAYWKIGFAHHPYISNGRHGNAGRYEGIPGLPFVSGVEVQEFIDDFICGEAQIYISGHDHNRQMFDPVCGTYFFVSGASAKTSGLENRDDNPTAWQDDTREGFLWVEIQGTQMTAAFYDFDANLDHEIIADL